MVPLQMMEVLLQTNSTLFVNVGTVLIESITPTDKNLVHCIEQDIINTQYFDPVTENYLCKIIGSLKDNASGWYDLKPSKMNI